MTAIVAKGRPLPDIAADALTALAAANDPPELFVRLGQLARVRADEKSRPLIDHVSEPLLRHRLARVAEWIRVDANRKVTAVPPPSEVVQDILAMKAWPFPPLEGITEVPFLRPDGTVLDQPGYDPVTGLVYQPAPGPVPCVPVTPSSTDIRAAVAALEDVFADFPFVDHASLANTIALALTPVVRPAIAGPVPMALVDKPKRGTGSTLLVQIITSITIGSDTELTTAPKDEDEWRKRITAGMLAAVPCMFFDNVEERLTSASLAAVLTSLTWSDRILGESRMARNLPQRATWMATGNNLKVGGDLARRCYLIRLDAHEARPWERNGFRHPDLLKHVRSRRCGILVALLTLARAWWAAGQPEAETPKMGSFDVWVRVIGGILAHAGFHDFLGNLTALYEEVDEEEMAWTAFVSTWHELWGTRGFTAKELTAALEDTSTDDGAMPLREVLPADLAEQLEKGGGKFSRRLGNALAKRDGSIFGAYRLGRDGERNRAVKWCVTPAPQMQRLRSLFPDTTVLEGAA